MLEMVGELIDHSVGSWNNDLVRTYFMEDEVKLILGLPISFMRCKNKVIWHYSRNGDYTVRTGYGVALELQANGELGRKGTRIGSGDLTD